MAKLSELSLKELYERDKITPAALKAIIGKEDFGEIRKEYCTKVCTAPCYMKDPEAKLLNHKKTDIMVIQSSPSMDDIWKNGEELDYRYHSIISFIFNRVKQGKVASTNKAPDWRIHNALKCRPFAKNRSTRDAISFGNKKPLPNNPSLTSSIIQRCAPYLFEEIRKSNPKVIISTSTMSTKALGFKHLSNYRHRGWVDFLEVNGKKIPVVITLHPEITTMIRQNASGQMWGPDYFSVIERDFEKAVDIACGLVDLKTIEEALEDIKTNNQIVVTESLEEVKYWTDKIKSFSGTNQIISWDTETTSLDPWYEDARFLCHQFGYTRKDGRVQAVVIPLWHKDNETYDPDKAWPMVKDILEDPDILKVAHNAAFDLKFTKVVKQVEVQGVIADTMLLLHALNSGISGNYSLKTSVWDFMLGTGLGGYEDQLDIELVKSIEEDTYEIPTPKHQKLKTREIPKKSNSELIDIMEGRLNAKT